MSIIPKFMAVVAILTAVFEFFQIAAGFIDEAFALGVLFYYMYLVTEHESEMQASLARKELELSQSKVMLLRQQIRPHFIFNSLQIIRALIKTDPAKAVTSLEDFSDYLSVNLDAVTSDSLISFDEELAHTEAYVALALADDNKNINVEYAINEHDFRLPPLTVEPIVENAIRHGLRHGGTVRISTRREDDDILIVVSDNGEGFGPVDAEHEKEQAKERTGTGIKNVRTRLAALCGGTLDIHSDAGGTDVTMHFPQCRNVQDRSEYQ